MNDPILEALGLTKEGVRKTFNLPEPESREETSNNYLFAGDQRRMRRRMKNYHKFILVRYLEGYPPKAIAGMLVVSEEAVRSRLRKAGMFRNLGRPGRPKRKLANKSCSSRVRLVRGRARPVSKAYSILCRVK